MARAAPGRHVLTWPLYPFASLFVNHSWDAIKFVDRISPRPVFFIHGDQDSIVPVRMSKMLYEKAKEPKKLWIVPGAGHLEPRKKEAKHYEEEIAEFFDKAFGS